MDQMIWTLLTLTAALAGVLSVGALTATLVLWRTVRRCGPVPENASLPPACIIMACKGVEERLGETLRALDAQTHPNYRVCIAVESERDPAFTFVRRNVASMRSRKFDLVIAQHAVDRSQKIENLLAAIDHVGDAAAVYAFTDSDAVPPPEWLRDLVAPLRDPRVGATTGFRWYARDGSLLGLVRCLWNALGLNWFGAPFVLMCWGGSMAMRRDAFERLDIRGAWSGTISDDLAVATVVRKAKLALRFVPRCVIPCYERTTWTAFLEFARRQLVLARVCTPDIWRAATLITVAFAALIIVAATAVSIGVTRHDSAMALAGVGAIVALILSNVPRYLLLHGAITPLLPREAQHAHGGLLDALILPFMVIFNAGMMLAASNSNRITWRGIQYELRSATETIRLDGVPRPESARTERPVTPEVETQRA